MDAEPESRERTLSVCSSLLDHGAPLASRNGFGQSRLHRCAFGENPRGVRFLLDVGHPIQTDEGTTVLHAICWHWDYGDHRDEAIREIIQALLAAGLSVHARSSEGNTPLHEALSGDGSNLVAAQQLLDAGADINAVNHDGVTPLLLHYETLSDYERVVPFMLERGANPLIADKRGQSVLDAARRMIAGGQPMWRTEAFAESGETPCGWKPPASSGDTEHQMLDLLERAAERFRRA